MFEILEPSNNIQGVALSKVPLFLSFQVRLQPIVQQYFYFFNLLMFQYYFELKLDGVRKWRLENRVSRRFSNVKIWAAQCRHGFPPANAYIDNLQYDLIGKTHINAY